MNKTLQDKKDYLKELRWLIIVDWVIAFIMLFMKEREWMFFFLIVGEIKWNAYKIIKLL